MTVKKRRQIRLMGVKAQKIGVNVQRQVEFRGGASKINYNVVKQMRRRKQRR